jgi:hypothetical protein
LEEEGRRRERVVNELEKVRMVHILGLEFLSVQVPVEM